MSDDPASPALGFRSCAESAFLTGADGRVKELVRAVGIFGELIRGFRTLHFAGPCVTVFGSARFSDAHRYYQLARELGAAVASAGFTVMTGGGPGIMEAACRGAREAGGPTVGCTIDLADPQPTNPYVDRELRFRHFFVRKVMLVKYSVAFVAMPGGFGTMDEIFETLTLSQSGKIRDFPLVLMGERYWRPLVDLIGESMIAEATIDPADLGRILVTDSPEEATRHILRCAEHRFGVKLVPPRASRILREFVLPGRMDRFTRRRHGLGRRRRSQVIAR